MLTTAELITAIEDSNYSIFALRAVGNEPLACGDDLPPSRRWYDGNIIYDYEWIDADDIETYQTDGYEIYQGDEAAEYAEYCGYYGDTDLAALAINRAAYTHEDGTCGIQVTADAADVERAMRAVSAYSGTQIVLIAGEIGFGGDDTGEVIIRNARVVAIVM